MLIALLDHLLAPSADDGIDGRQPRFGAAVGLVGGHHLAQGGDQGVSALLVARW